MNILLLAGSRKSGKTEAANIICKLDNRFKKCSFADPLRDLYCKKYNVQKKELLDPFEKEKHRINICDMGDEEREKNPYVFAVEARNRLEPNGFYVFDDLRRIEELEVMFKLGAVPFGVYCENKIRKERGWVYNPFVDEHPSETELGYCSAYAWYCLGGGQINNNGSLEETKRQLVDLLKIKFPYKIEDLEMLGKKK